MADFCNYCTLELFGDVTSDIDVYGIYNDLKQNHYISVLCEGCTLSAVGNICGELKVQFMISDSDESAPELSDFVDYNELEWRDSYEKYQ